MKFRNYFYAFLCGLALTAGFASCSSDDDDEWDPAAEGSNVEMVKTRGFILNEGLWGHNNAHLNYFDYVKDEVLEQDLYQTQNGKMIGDVGQDLVAYDDNLYLSVNVSNYVAKLNGVGKELARVDFNEYPELGIVRFLTANDGYLYATSYGGYVTKIDAKTLNIVGSVKVGHHPERMIVSNGNIYCVNGSYYPENDNRVSVIDEKTFTLVKNVDIIDNPQSIIEVGGQIVVQGYGADWIHNPVVLYDRKAEKCSEPIGFGSYIAEYNDILYVLYSKTEDWANYETELYSYDVRTGKKNTNVLKNAPEELLKSNTNGFSINEKTGHLYILVTKYDKGDGEVYHFDNNGNYVGKFTSGGQNPKKIVFVD